MTVYVSQVIMLYTLKLYSAICQLYLNKTERVKKGSMLVPHDLLHAQGVFHTKILPFSAVVELL